MTDPVQPEPPDAHDRHVTDYHGYVAVPDGAGTPQAGPPGLMLDRLPDSFLMDAKRVQLDRCRKTTSAIRMLDKINSMALMPPGTPGTDPSFQATGYREAAAACLALAEACEREARR